jgi:hypothetical protein
MTTYGPLVAGDFYMNISRKALLIGLLAVGGCTTSGGLPPIEGNHPNVTNQDICTGVYAFASDFPATIWPGRDKSYYQHKRDFYAERSTVLFKVLVDKYGKEDAGSRAKTGYSTAKSIAYVIGGATLIKSLETCEPVYEDALNVSSDYSKFVKNLEDGNKKAGLAPAKKPFDDPEPQVNSTTFVPPSAPATVTTEPVAPIMVDPIADPEPVDTMQPIDSPRDLWKKYIPDQTDENTDDRTSDLNRSQMNLLGIPVTPKVKPDENNSVDLNKTQLRQLDDLGISVKLSEKPINPINARK